MRIRLKRGKRLSQQEAARIEAELGELAGEITQTAQDLRNRINDLNADILRDGLLPALYCVAVQPITAIPANTRCGGENLKRQCWLPVQNSASASCPVARWAGAIGKG